MFSLNTLTRVSAAVFLFTNLAFASDITPNPLLAIDQNRLTVIDRVVTEWGPQLAQSSAALSPEQLRTILSGLRSDHLLAASLAGNLDGLRNTLSNALTSTAEVKQTRIHGAALGDPDDDLVYTPVVPCRIMDTRFGTLAPYNSPIVGGAAFPVSGNLSNFSQQGGSSTNCGMPANFAAIVVVLTVLNPNFDAYLAASSSSNFATLTQAVVMNFSANKGLANTAIVPVDANVRFYLGLPAQVSTNVIADVVGYFRAPAGGQYFGQGGNAFGTTAVLGTTDNQPLSLTVNGSPVVRYQPDAISPNVIGGSNANNVSAGVYGAVIGGGGSSATSLGFFPIFILCGGAGFNCANTVTDAFGTVGGGFANRAGDFAGSATDAFGATVGGGYVNGASGAGTVGGGGFNHAGPAAVVGGGTNNVASGSFSVVPGGYINQTSADYTFAAGIAAHANSTGCFVWGDSSQGQFPSAVSCNGPNRFVARSEGGVYFFSGNDGTNTDGHYTGVALLPGAQAWTATSDRAGKDNIDAVEPRRS